MNAIASDRASSSHPAKNDRLPAITRGWNAAKTEIPGNTNLRPIDDPNWISLAIQSTKTHTVMLRDDGKTYQAAELKGGEPFLFRFEIYNYGWLKLPYYNGFRTFKLMHGKDYSILWNRCTKNCTVV